MVEPSHAERVARLPRKNWESRIKAALRERLDLLQGGSIRLVDPREARLESCIDESEGSIDVAMCVLQHRLCTQLRDAGE